MSTRRADYVLPRGVRPRNLCVDRFGDMHKQAVCVGMRTRKVNYRDHLLSLPRQTDHVPDVDESWTRRATHNYDDQFNRTVSLHDCLRSNLITSLCRYLEIYRGVNSSLHDARVCVCGKTPRQTCRS